MEKNTINFKKTRTYPIKQRKNLVKIDQFVKPIKASKEFNHFFTSLPNILCAKSFNNVIESIVSTFKNGNKVGVAIGAHVIKCGLSPLIIDLMERGIVNCVSMSGAVAIHDYEISLIGATSEDVADGIDDGTFGMAYETGTAIQAAANSGNKTGIGFGKALGNMILDDNNKFKDFSIIAAGARLNIPITVHIAMGTDIVHMHPDISGSDLGGSSHTDFKILTSFISGLENGVWLNIGSAVIMPEVFLKALTLANNLKHNVRNITTVNMDMIKQYRAETNVVRRPTQTGYSIIGHHEIMIPLLYAGIISALEKEVRSG